MNKSAVETDSRGNEILYSASPAMFRARPFSFLLCVLLIPALGLGLAILLVWYVKTRGHRLMVTPHHVIYRVGIFSKRVNELRTGDVRDVNIYQNLIHRITNVGLVEIASAGSTERADFSIQGMPDPERVRTLIFSSDTPGRVSTD